MRKLNNLSDLLPTLPEFPIISIAGAGGKTTLMIKLSHLLIPSVMTTTTKVGADQILAADRCFDFSSFKTNSGYGSVWVSPSLKPVNGKIIGFTPEEFIKLAEICRAEHYSLICEADGASRRHVKAPNEHEPVIPEITDMCVYVVGMDIIGKPMNGDNVHRPEIFSLLTGFEYGEEIDAECLVRLLDHPCGGLKNIPDNALKVIYLTHVNSDKRYHAAEYIMNSLKKYDFFIANE